MQLTDINREMGHVYENIISLFFSTENVDLFILEIAVGKPLYKSLAHLEFMLKAVSKRIGKSSFKKTKNYIDEYLKENVFTTISEVDNSIIQTFKPILVKENQEISEIPISEILTELKKEKEFVLMLEFLAKVISDGRYNEFLKFSVLNPNLTRDELFLKFNFSTS